MRALDRVAYVHLRQGRQLESRALQNESETLMHTSLVNENE